MRYDEAMKRPRPKPEMIEGPEAFQRFEDAMKAVLKVPKSAIPSPFGKKDRGKENTKDESKG